MTNPFSAPSSGGEVVPPRDLVGQLLIVRPLSVEKVQTQAFGEKEAVRVNIAVLTMQNLDGSYGVVHEDVLWFSGRIIGALKRQLGDLVLARMAQGTGKPGQQPPFQLDSAVEDAQAVAFASDWLAKHPDFATSLKSPSTPPAAAAVPAPAPVPAALPTPAQVAAVPAAVAAPAPVPAAAPAAVPVAAAPPAAAQIDPSVLAKLSPDALAQLQQLAAQQAATA